MKPQCSSDRRITLASRKHLKPISAHLQTPLPFPTTTTLSSLPCSYLLRPLLRTAVDIQDGEPCLLLLAVGTSLSRWQCLYNGSFAPSKATSSASVCPVDKKKKVGLYCTRKLLSLCALMLAFDCNPDVEILRTDLSGSFWVSTTGEDSWSPLERGWQESCLWEEPQYSSLPR